MRILSIETSCDETAVSIVEATRGLENPIFSVLGNALFSQIDIHKEFGGVFPMIAKREHAKKLPTLLKKTLVEADMHTLYDISYSVKKWKEIKTILVREENLYEGLKNVLENIQKPDIDVISVTSGPGLAPALWVGISFATALGKLWGIPVVPVNHMEGHICSVLLNRTDKIINPNNQFPKKQNKIQFPAIALLISGGHTELVEVKNWGEYKILGETRDDAVGEAFDKVARMLGLPYPGGPEISKLAQRAREENLLHTAKFPRPMIHSNDFDFSFAGLKTSVLYYLRETFGREEPTLEQKTDIAREFEDAVVDVLVYKTKKTLEDVNAKTLIIAGGVIANKKLREVFGKFETEYTNLEVKIPTHSMTGDNALMIACASYINILLYPELLSKPQNIIANGNLRLS